MWHIFGRAINVMLHIFWRAIDVMLHMLVRAIDEAIRLLGRLKEKVEETAVERAAELSVNTGTSYVNLGSDMQSLARNMRALSSRASDIKEKVEKAELSGRKKRKTEVKYWLEEVKELENEFVALQRRAQQERFWKRLLVGGHAKKMKDQVTALTEQSRNFNVLDVRRENGESHG